MKAIVLFPSLVQPKFFFHGEAFVVPDVYKPNVKAFVNLVFNLVQIGIGGIVSISKESIKKYITNVLFQLEDERSCDVAPSSIPPLCFV